MLNIQNVKDLDKIFSSLYITNERSSGYPSITLRGMRSGYYYNPNVRLYIDGVPQDSLFINQELLSVKSVELFKGWGGSIYGENAPAGIIEINSNLASNELRANATLMGGNKDIMFMGDVSGAIIKDRLYAKASFKHNTFFGQIKNAANGNLADKTHSNLGRFSLLYDDSRFYGGIDYYIDSGIFNDAFLNAQEIGNKDNLAHTFDGGVPSVNRLTHTAALKIGYNLDSVSIINTLSYQNKNADFNNFGAIYTENNGKITNELKIKQGWYDAVSLYGIFFSHNDFTHKYIDDTNKLKDTEFALFSDHKIFLPYSLTLNLGFRYQYNLATINYLAHTNGSFSDKKEWHNFGVRLGLSYAFSNDYRVYAMLSRGFKKGGFYNIIYNDSFKSFYRPEGSYNAEIGYKGIFYDNLIYINAAYFFSYQQDKQENLLLTNSQPIIGNLSNVISHGFEFEGKIEPIEGSFMMLNFAYINANFVNTPNPPRHILYTPDFNINALLDSALFRGNIFDLYMTTSISYKTRIWYANNYSQKPYTLWNLSFRAIYKGNLSLSFNIENVLDTLYVTYAFINNGVAYNQIGRLRSYSATLNYKF